MSNKTIKMPKKKLEKWLKALRSGEFKQGRGILYDPQNYTFCCLGVLQHCVSNGKVELDEDGYFRGLPSQDWAKKHGIWYIESPYGIMFDDFNPVLDFGEGGGGIMDAATANDEQGKTFPEIADALEKCVETY